MVHVFVDLHGVLADARAIGRRYEAYLVRVLGRAGIDAPAAKHIHGQVLSRWVQAFRAESDVDDGDGFDEGTFIARMKQVDDDWETFILDRVPGGWRDELRPMLATAAVEYDAMVHAPCEGLLFLDVIPALERLHSSGITMHVASSASTNHVRGTIESCGLAPYFQCLIGWDAVSAPKKARYGLYFSRMLAQAGVAPGDSWFAGDSVEEGVLASAMDMRYVLVDRTRDAALRDRARGHGFPVVDDMGGLAALLT